MSHLSIQALKKRYDGKQVLHGVDVEIEHGQFVVIVGPSGCGKSTLLRMIAGLESITEGVISIDGEEINDLDPADRGCAMVFQNYALYPHMTVRENMAYPLKIARMAKEEREKRVAEAAAMLDLTALLDRRPAQLSGGQRQRVAMGRALVREPRVFLFDEPLSNLDAKLRVTMRIEIKRLHRRLKATSIFVTHDQTEAMTLADTMIVMNGGNVEQVGTPLSIYREPASTFVASFLGAPAMNLMPARANDRGVVLQHLPQFAIALDRPLVAEGDAVTFGIRPEDIVVSPPGPTGHPARIDLIEELGGSRIAYCSLGNQEVAVMLPKGGDQREGETVHLSFPARSVHLFDIETGLRLVQGSTEPARASVSLVPA